LFDILMEAGREATIYGMHRTRSEEDATTQILIERGMAVNELDITDLIAATAPVREAFVQRHPAAQEIMDALLALTN